MACVRVAVPDQVMQALERVAAKEGKQVEEVVQLAIHNFLATHADPDPEWRTRFEQVIAQIRRGVPAGLSPEEIEADVTAAREELRRERRARGH
jgi:hypothetical protein